MSEELEAIKEGSKAIQEASRTGKAVVEAGSNLAEWASKVLGTLPEDVVGLAIGDHVRQLRIRNLDKISRKTDEILRKRQIENPKPINLKHAIPIFEAAGEETDETLQDLWARLLANAMDPESDIQLQRILIDALKAFEPIDALVFETIMIAEAPAMFTINKLAKDRNMRSSLFKMSAERLTKIGCINPHSKNPLIFIYTTLGEELWLAIKDDGEE